MVQPGQHARHRHPVLSRPSAPDAAREEDDARRRGRHRSECMGILRHEAGHVVQHAYQLQRRRRWQQLFGPSSKRYPRYYRPNPASRNYRPASAALVRAEPSGRGFRRDLRGVAAAALELADALRRLAGAQEARICRRADGAKSPANGRCSPTRERSIRCSELNETLDEPLREEAGVLRLRGAEDLRPRPAPALLRRSAASPVAAGFEPSSGATAPRSGSWWRSGPAKTSSRSTPCSTT